MMIPERWVKILSQWDYLDDIDKTGPTIFQSILSRILPLLVFQDELGEELARTMLDKMVLLGGKA